MNLFFYFTLLLLSPMVFGKIDLVGTIFNQSSAFIDKVNVDDPMPKFVVSKYFDKTGLKRDKLITLLVSTTFSGEMPVGSIASKSMELALDRLYLQPDWLSDYNIALELVDNQCVDSKTVNLVVPKLRDPTSSINRFPLFLDPGCEAFGLKTVAESLKYFNYVGVS